MSPILRDWLNTSDKTGNTEVCFSTAGESTGIKTEADRQPCGSDRNA